MCTGTNGMTKAFRRYADYHEINCGTPNINELMLAKAREIKPDLLFLQIQTEGVINPITVEIIRHELRTIIFNFSGDVREPLPKWYMELAPIIHSTLFTNMVDVETVKAAGHCSDFLEIGFDPEIYNPIGPVNFKAPIVFMGNNYRMFPLSEERVQTVDALKQRFGDRFAYFGNGWNPPVESFNHSQQEEAAVYRGARIAINLSHFDYDSYSSDRILRIMGTGTMCVCRNFKNVEKRFREGDLLLYDTINQLLTICDYFLQNEHESQRRTIAENGSIFVHAHHTFEEFTLNILKLYDTYKTKSDRLHTSSLW